MSLKKLLNEYTLEEIAESIIIPAKLTVKQKKEFAAEIQIHETLLSHLISNRREPSESIIIRLELLSNKIIPAIYWYNLIGEGKRIPYNNGHLFKGKGKPVCNPQFATYLTRKIYEVLKLRKLLKK